MNIAANLKRRRDIGEIINGYMVTDGHEFRISDDHAGSDPYVNAAPL
jgi:hypothetical protein